MTPKCKHCGAPVNLAPDGDPKYEAPAPKAGVLRFEMNGTSDMCLLDLNSDPWILPGYTREDVIKMAQSLGLTAEFVEDGNGYEDN